ncbi:hypothetical protein DF182_30165 [Chitinophaga flava]|uniref:Uncharacterized protein n=1 Tax=Chitinophaga flava TaxID=2259036 RepID=A0A365XWG9_9BACT|nr:hypothetical protein DF182_30165 [Chitinophaga flava]
MDNSSGLQFAGNSLPEFIHRVTSESFKSVLKFHTQPLEATFEGFKRTGLVMQAYVRQQKETFSQNSIPLQQRSPRYIHQGASLL